MSLPELEVGDNVRLQDPISKRWKEEGIVLHVGEHRDYIVELSNGKRRWRNRKFLRRNEAISQEAEDEEKKQTDIEFRPRRSSRDRKKSSAF